MSALPAMQPQSAVSPPCFSQCLLLSVAWILNTNASTMNAMITCSTT